MTEAKLDEETLKATEMLSGKTVRLITRHRKSEIMIEFTDGTRLFVDRTSEGLDLSITGCIEG